MCPHYPESKVEISGLTAKYYDTLMDIITFGRYSSLMQKAISLMSIKPNDRIIDLGAGTGMNALLMMRYLSLKGKLTGLDISEEMIGKFRRRCAGFTNAEIVNQRIDRPLMYEDKFDKAFISFVLHGFPQKVRILVIRNVFKALRKRGEFFILDYNEFRLKQIPFYMKIYFELIECPYAFDFIERNWYEILADEGFNHFEKHLFFNGYIRLLKGVRVS
jgi:ubiquinone/menaquinone biosynthesis C-methylase UbiE